MRESRPALAEARRDVLALRPEARVLCPEPLALCRESLALAEVLILRCESLAWGVAFGCDILSVAEALARLCETLAGTGESLSRESLALLSEALILWWEPLTRGGETLAWRDTVIRGEALILGSNGLAPGGLGVSRPGVLRRGRETRLREPLSGLRCGGSEPALGGIEGPQLSRILLRFRRIRLPQNRRIRGRHGLLGGIACRLRLITLRARLIRRVPRCRHGGERTIAAP